MTLPSTSILFGAWKHSYWYKYKTKQMTLDDLQPPGTEEFNKALCTAFMIADMPMFKVQNANFWNFLEKYVTRKVPSEGILCQKYILIKKAEGLRKLREKIGDHYIWVSMDETVDKMGRLVYE